MKKNAMYYITIILTILFILVSTYSYAAEVTKESLTKFFEDFVKESESDGTIEVTDTEIIIKLEGEEYTLEYDVIDKPTFSIDMVFKEGMTYDECTEEAIEVILPTYGFMAVAGINGIDTSVAAAYGMPTIMETFAKNTEVEAITEENFVNTMDFVEKVYSKDVIIEDDLFTMTIKKAELRGEEYVVETELIVDTEKDFSVLEDRVKEEIFNTINGGLSNSIGSMANQIVPGTSIATNNTVNKTSTPTPPLPTIPPKANIGKMPNAGFEINTLNILKVVLGLSLAGVIVYSIYNKRYSSK